MTLEKELSEFKNTYESSKKEEIEFNTQIKILKQNINERNENIEMLNEEVLTWIFELDKEREIHKRSLKTIADYEIKLNSMKREKNVKISN